MSETIRLLFLGDLVGKPGRALFQKWASSLKSKHKADSIIVNGENSSDIGRGITKKIADFFFEYGADAITSGNHIWCNKESHLFITQEPRLLRPANFPSGCPGKGYTFITVKGHTVAIMSLQGRVFMHEHLDCPFRTMESLLPFISSKTNLIFLDFHAEATSEKEALGYFLDGKVSGVFGTHTHVQTADERVLPHGTSYISDLGYSGALNSLLGMRKEEITHRFLTQMPRRFAVENEGPFVMHGICVEVDTKTGKSVSIERVKIIDEDLVV
jgi:hypothetical protein